MSNSKLHSQQIPSFKMSMEIEIKRYIIYSDKFGKMDKILNSKTKVHKVVRKLCETCQEQECWSQLSGTEGKPICSDKQTGLEQSVARLLLFMCRPAGSVDDCMDCIVNE